MALAQAGKPKEAVAAAQSYLKATPAEILFVVDLVPLLDRMGAKAEADEVFRASLAPLQALLKDYPDSPLYNNQAAWLSANARRELDAALVQARRATTLAPEIAGYKDTLAEVLFRRGDKAGAIEIMQKLVDRSVGRRPYYQFQLERFRAGDITVPPPDEP
jgi:tetratricopeptide (TPR) repeat protein